METGKLLIVDDEMSVRDSLAKWFGEDGYEVGTAESASEALTRVAETDLRRRPGRHQDARHRRNRVTAPLARDLSRHAGHHHDRLRSVETAIAALKNGAYDYINKPLDPEETAHLISKAMSHRRTQQENIRLKETVAEIARPSDIIGQSAAMKKHLRCH